jgi:hypothetical protein
MDEIHVHGFPNPLRCVSSKGYALQIACRIQWHMFCVLIRCCSAAAASGPDARSVRYGARLCSEAQPVLGSNAHSPSTLTFFVAEPAMFLGSIWATMLKPTFRRPEMACRASQADSPGGDRSRAR